MSASITLSMIVRDEQEVLPKFLERARGLYDELCVVDTGSRDQTVEILKNAGATVIHHPWNDDFSAARNAGLQQATGDWILFLDADEFALPELVKETRRVADDNNVGAATLIMRNEMPHGHCRESRLLRLFRRDPTIRFRHPIHEDVSETTAEYLRRSGRRLVHICARVEHIGYTRNRAGARDKKARDSRILLSCLEQNPDDFYSHFKLLELARFWSDSSLWQKAAASAADALELSGRRVLQNAHFGGELIVLISQGLHATNGEAALKYLDTWEPNLLPSGAFFLRRAELHELAGRMEKARDDFQRCLGLQGSMGNLQLTTVRPLLGLARLAIASGALSEASSLVERALAINPRDLEALLAGATLSRATGGKAALEVWRSHRIAADGDSLELHQTIGEAAMAAGDFQCKKQG